MSLHKLDTFFIDPDEILLRKKTAPQWGGFSFEESNLVVIDLISAACSTTDSERCSQSLEPIGRPAAAYAATAAHDLAAQGSATRGLATRRSATHSITSICSTTSSMTARSCAARGLTAGSRTTHGLTPIRGMSHGSTSGGLTSSG